MAGKLILYEYLTVTIAITTGKKSSSRLSGGCAIIITTGKKNSSHLSGGCAIAITTGKKVRVVCLAGARLLLRPKKKVLGCLAGARLLLFLPWVQFSAKSSDFYAKLNVSNLNLTNLY